MTLFEAKKYCISHLSDLYPEREIDSIFNIIIEFLLSYSKTDIHLNNDIELSDIIIEKYKKIVTELKASMPIQYILGQTEFYSLKFEVNGAVLIPRQETEELVDHVVKEYSANVTSILDIGTGSGCIAIALKHCLPETNVYACDISKDALNIAKENAKINNSAVNFFHYDILNNELIHEQTYDLIVSNPPYVTNSEKNAMHSNVLDFEPSLALFVEDETPLLYYKAILRFAQQHLNKNGKLLVEINEQFGKQTMELFAQNNYTNLKLITDLNGKDRFVYGEK